MARRKQNPQMKRGPFLSYLEVLRERIPSLESYPFSLPAFRNLEQLPLHPKVTFLVGENGSGKSTLLEAIAVLSELNPEGGGRHFNFSTRASHSKLDDCLRLAKIRVARTSYLLRAESFFNAATELERLDAEPLGGPKLIDVAYGGVSPHEQSHGESFFALFKNRFRWPGLYLLDEPEAALSPKRQLEFIALLHQYCQIGSQFIIATHSPMIMAYPDAAIYVLGPNGLTLTPYTETEHFLITRGFLANPQRNLSLLMDDP